MEHTRSQKIRWLVVSLLIVIAQLTPRYGARTPRARSALKARDIASSTHLIIFAGLLLAVLMVTFGPASLRAVFTREACLTLQAQVLQKVPFKLFTHGAAKNFRAPVAPVRRPSRMSLVGLTLHLASGTLVHAFSCLRVR